MNALIKLGFVLFILANVTLPAISTSAIAAPICENKIAKIEFEFDGAGVSSCKARKRHFIIEIRPEDVPINPSPWYAFHVTPKGDEDVRVTLRYIDGRHRYHPKTSIDGKVWQVMASDHVDIRRKGKKVRLEIDAADGPLFVAGQELIIDEDYEAWRTEILASDNFQLVDIGRSVEDRPLWAITSAPSNTAQGPASVAVQEYVLFVGRQHPPEVTGAIAMIAFLDTVFGDSDLARQFRDRFHIIAAPFLNPDGVAHGHWRHNVNGVDLNRDWGPFSQPETQSMKRILDEMQSDETKKLALMFDFHSTKRNVFYTQTDEDVIYPVDFTDQWLDGARTRIEDLALAYEFEKAPRDLSDLPTSKNYVFRTFGVPAVTYEVGDETDRAATKQAAKIFAEEMMKTLLGAPMAP